MYPPFPSLLPPLILWAYCSQEGALCSFWLLSQCNCNLSWFLGEVNSLFLQESLDYSSLLLPADPLQKGHRCWCRTGLTHYTSRNQPANTLILQQFSLCHRLPCTTPPFMFMQNNQCPAPGAPRQLQDPRGIHLSYVPSLLPWSSRWVWFRHRSGQRPEAPACCWWSPRGLPATAMTNACGNAVICSTNLCLAGCATSSLSREKEVTQFLCCRKPCLALSALSCGAERSRSPSKGDVSRFTAEVGALRGRLIEDWVTQMNAEGPTLVRDKE